MKQGSKHTKETLAKMSEVKLGITFTVEHRANLSRAAIGKQPSRKPMTKEHKAKIAAALRGKTRVFTDEHRAALSKALTGRKHDKRLSDEQVAKQEAAWVIKVPIFRTKK